MGVWQTALVGKKYNSVEARPLAILQQYSEAPVTVLSFSYEHQMEYGP